VKTQTQRHDKNKIYSHCMPKALRQSVYIVIKRDNNIETIHEYNPVNVSDDQYCKLYWERATVIIFVYSTGCCE
jgi:hypothetical protein